MSRRRMLVACALLLATPCAPAAAASAQCIPAARFSTLARITDGSMTQLTELIGLPGQTPPPDACRSLLLSGALTRGSAAALLTEISRNKGWLATIYIAVADGDLKEEIEIAQLMRDFRLAGQVVVGPGPYLPDFLTLPRTMPASVSESWPVPEQAGETPLAISFRDYLDNTDRKIRPQTTCGASCWTILAGAVERAHSGTPRAAADAEPAQPAESARVREAARREFGANVTLVRQSSGYVPVPKMADRANVDRGEIDIACKTAVDYATTLGAEIVEASNRFAANRFPFMRLQSLQQKVRRFAEASGNAELCVRKVMTRRRMTVFAERCAPTCEDRLAEVESAAGAALSRYGSSMPKDATAPASAPPTADSSTANDAEVMIPAPLPRQPQRRR